MKDKIEIKTSLGNMTVETNNSDKFPGVVIKLNNAPVLTLEQTVENKLVISRFQNKDVYTDDQYFNADKYEISFDKSTVLDILKDINTEEEK